MQEKLENVFKLLWFIFGTAAYGFVSSVIFILLGSSASKYCIHFINSIYLLQHAFCIELAISFFYDKVKLQLNVQWKYRQHICTCES